MRFSRLVLVFIVPAIAVLAGADAAAQSMSITVMNGQPGYIADTSASPFVVGQVPAVGGYSPLNMFMPRLPPAFLPDPNDDSYYRTDGLSETRRLAARRLRAMETMSQWRSAMTLLPDSNPPVELPPPPARPAKPVPSTSAHSASAVGNATDPDRSSSAARAVPGVAEARRLRELEQQSQNDEARVLLERGISAEEDDKPNVARIYYKMAAKRATGDIHQQALDRLEALNTRR